MRDIMEQYALSPNRMLTLTLTREKGRFFAWHHARDGSGWQHLVQWHTERLQQPTCRWAPLS
jgi:hypothetical protein